MIVRDLDAIAVQVGEGAADLVVVVEAQVA
jgi:hypothetical protein